ncbi:hypothetical protein J3F84DRAFT_244298 [Trichoderma pleuroticola]
MPADKQNATGRSWPTCCACVCVCVCDSLRCRQLGKLKHAASSQNPMPPFCFSAGVALCRALTLVPVQANATRRPRRLWKVAREASTTLSSHFNIDKDDHPNGAGGSVKRPWASGCYQRSFHRRRPREPIDIHTDLPKREAIDKGPLLRPHVIVHFLQPLLSVLRISSVPSHPSPARPGKGTRGCWSSRLRSHVMDLISDCRACHGQ